MTHRRLHRRALCAALCSLPWMLMVTPASSAPQPAAAGPATPAMPEELQPLLPGAQLRGSGVLRFFGLRVYEARLWTTPAFSAEDYASQRLGLVLSYDRRLEGAAIADRSIAEMRRVGAFSEVQAQQWLILMKQAFPDVKPGDRLLGWHDGQGGVRFYYNGRQTAELSDPLYARLFFGIWLAPQSSAPALRQSLLGLPG
ncbi:chalcone isomerase family protein [Mitsuaria sp. WAJ17]|uniref:chalcone isomerase family protein n=1 Tax=Mitsuaria sp. WAJ17 TaxID=2761452 RepID=UPI0038576A8F